MKEKINKKTVSIYIDINLIQKMDDMTGNIGVKKSAIIQNIINKLYEKDVFDNFENYNNFINNLDRYINVKNQ